MDKATLLIVDDVPVNIQVLAACLKDKYLIKVATSGEQCLQLSSAEQKPDLILLDIGMPDMDGYEVCKHLKNNKNTASIPVIFVTGKDNEKDEEQGFLLGAVDYITKPISPVIVAARVATHITLKQQRDALENMAMHDQLTGLYNRHYLLEVAKHKLARAKRHRHTLSLLMLDVDHFKTINDTLGHAAGDNILKALAKLMDEQNRSEDIVARFGGEEFVILLDQCDAQAAKNKAKSLLQTIESLNPDGISVTASIGISELSNREESFAELLKRADLAVYQAKDKGRNCIEIM